MRSFLEVLSPCITSKLEMEIPDALRKNRLEDLEKRTFRWIEKSFWGDIAQFPDELLDKRILRLKRVFESSPQIPRRQGDGEHFPISVFVEYDTLLKVLKSAFRRQPGKPSRLPREYAKEFVDQTIGGGRGYSRPLVLEALYTKRVKRWETQQLRQANRVLSIPEWPSGQGFCFGADEILRLTPRKAALRVLGAKMQLGEEAVWDLVKKGKKMLPLQVLRKMEAAHSAVDTNSSWEYLNRLDPLQ